MAFGRASVAVAESPCALSNPPSFAGQPPCAHYTVRRARVLATFTRSAFHSIYYPGALTTLADGSAIVEEAPYALFRIHDDRAGVMWAPWGSRYYGRYYPLHSVRSWIGSPPPRPSPLPTWAPYYFYLLGSFDNTTVIQYGDDWIYGLASNGSVDFRFRRSGTELMDRPTFFGRDPDGTFWFESGSTRFQRDTVYAVFPRTNKLLALEAAVENVFQGPSGFIYATLGKNLVELRSIPNPQAHYYRGPIPLKAGDLYGATDITVSRIGVDGSAWASTPFEVIHEHPNGQVSVIRLSSMPSTITRSPSPIAIRPAPDGSAWIAGCDKLVRLTKSDGIEVMSFPGLGCSELHFSFDSTVWVKDAYNANVIMHVSPPRD